jgi:hypothetical protein
LSHDIKSAINLEQEPAITAHTFSTISTIRLHDVTILIPIN